MQTFPQELSTNPITVIVNWPELLKKPGRAKGHSLEKDSAMEFRL